MSRLTVVAKVVARKDRVEALKAELFKLIEPTRQEVGCIDYTLHQDNDHPEVFIFYETWESGASLEKHVNSEHFKAFVAAGEALIEEKAVHKLTRIR